MNSINININKRYSKNFEKFWILYDKKVGHKQKAYQYFCKLTEEEITKLFEILPHWLLTIGKNKKYRPYPTSFLYQRRWEDDIPDTYKFNKKKNKIKEIPPLDIIRKRAGSHSRQIIKNYKLIFDKNDNTFYNKINMEKSIVANALCDLHIQIKKARPDNAYKATKHSQQIGSPSKIVEEFIHWLKKEKWIDNINKKLFTFDSLLFQKFLKQYSKEIGINVITGRLY